MVQRMWEMQMALAKIAISTSAIKSSQQERCHKHVTSWEMSLAKLLHFWIFSRIRQLFAVSNSSTSNSASAHAATLRNTKTSLTELIALHRLYMVLPKPAHILAILKPTQGSPGPHRKVGNARHPGVKSVNHWEAMPDKRFARDISSVIYTNFSSISDTSFPSLPK